MYLSGTKTGGTVGGLRDMLEGKTSGDSRLDYSVCTLRVGQERTSSQIWGPRLLISLTLVLAPLLTVGTQAQIARPTNISREVGEVDYCMKAHDSIMSAQKSNKTPNTVYVKYNIPVG